jgi:hypothetical protein
MEKVIILICLILTSSSFNSFAQEQATLRDLYLRARSELEKTALITPFQNLSATNGIRPDLVLLVDELQKHRYVMAEFLCAKFAAQDRLDTIDAVLLRDVAGIDLIWSEKLVTEGVDLDSFIQESFGRFKRDFQAKVFDNPNDEIKRTSAALARRIPDVLAPRDVMLFRRFGVFGIPALIDEVKQSGSQHAFAALLILLGNREEYARCLEQGSTLYPDTAARLQAIRSAVRNQETRQKIKTKLLDKIVESASY